MKTLIGVHKEGKYFVAVDLLTNVADQAVDLVLDLLASGWDEATIVKEYPGLCRDDILACIRYAQEIIRSERVYSTTHKGKITG